MERDRVTLILTPQTRIPACRLPLAASPPGVLMLLGPFVDAEHPGLASGSADRTAEAVFREEVLRRLAAWRTAAGGIGDQRGTDSEEVRGVTGGQPRLTLRGSTVITPCAARCGRSLACWCKESWAYRRLAVHVTERLTPPPVQSCRRLHHTGADAGGARRDRRPGGAAAAHDRGCGGRGACRQGVYASVSLTLARLAPRAAGASSSTDLQRRVLRPGRVCAAAIHDSVCGCSPACMRFTPLRKGCGAPEPRHRDHGSACGGGGLGRCAQGTQRGGAGARAARGRRRAARGAPARAGRTRAGAAQVRREGSGEQR